jgi:hypothetical protein
MVLTPKDFGISGSEFPGPKELPSGQSQLKLVATLTSAAGKPVTGSWPYTILHRPTFKIEVGNNSSVSFVPVETSDVPLVQLNGLYSLKGNHDFRASYSDADPGERARVPLPTQMMKADGTLGSVQNLVFDLNQTGLPPDKPLIEGFRRIDNPFPNSCASEGHQFVWVQVRSGQILKSDPLVIPAECVLIPASTASASGPPTPMKIPDTTTSLSINLSWAYGASTRKLQRTVTYSGAVLNGPAGGASISGGSDFVTLNGNTGSMTDSFNIQIPETIAGGAFFLVVQVAVKYELVDASGNTANGAAAQQLYSVTHTTTVPAGSGTTNLARGSLDSNSTKQQSTSSSFDKETIDAAGFWLGVPSLLDRIGPDPHAATPHVSTAVPPFLETNELWSFSPGIPRDGNFSGTLTLFYDPADFPDDPNFDPTKLQMVSYDPSTQTIQRLPSTVDTTRQTVSAPVDWLAPYYSLVVFGPFSRKTLGAPALDGSSGISLVNPAASTDAAELDTYGSSPARTPLSLPAGQENASMVSSLIPATADGSWLLARTAVNTAGVQLIAGSNGFEAPEMPASPAAYSVFPTALFTANASTSFEVVNPNPWDATVMLTLFGSDGTQAGANTFPLPAMTKRTIAFADVFPGVLQPFSGYVILNADHLVYTSALTQSTQAISIANAQPIVTVATTGLYAPYLGTDGVLSLVNLDTNATSVTIRAFRADGTAGASPQAITVQPGQQYRERLANVFGVNVLPPGSLFVDGAPATMYGDLTIGDPLFLTLSSLPLVRSGRTSAVIPYAANDSSNQTSISIASTGAAANVIVTAFQPNGTAVGSASASLAANGSLVQPLQQLIAQATSLNPGYLRVDSDQPVLAYASIIPSGTTDFAIVTGQPAPAGQTVTPPPAAAAISVSSASLDFGNVTVGQTPAMSITITNKGGGTLTVTGLSAPNGPFSLVSPPAVPFNVPAAGTTLTVRFSPTSPGAQSSAFSIASNGSNKAVAVNLTGTGVAAPAVPSISVSPASLSFGSVTVGQTPALSLTVTNTGTGTLTVSSLTLPGRPFTLVSPPATPFNVPSGGTTITVRFAPTSAVASSATLSITSNGSNTPVQVPISGTGTAPTSGGGGSGNITSIKMEVGQYSATTSPPTLTQVYDIWDTDNSTKNWILGVTNSGSFANPLLNTNGKTVNLPVPPNSYTLYASADNLFDHDVRLTVVWSNGATDVAYFSANSNRDQAVFPRESGSANLSLTNLDAANAGQNACKVFQGTAVSGCSGRNYILVLTIAGVSGGGGGISASPTSLDFGNVTVGQTSQPKTLTLTNTGTSPATASLVTSAPFAVSPASLTIPANGSATATVTFSPTSAGSSGSSVYARLSGQTTPAATVALAGSGVAPGSGVQTYQLVADSGTFDQLSGFPGGTATAYFVNRLTPPSYPATLRSGQIVFFNDASSLASGTPITVLSGTVSATATNINNVGLTSTSTTVGQLDGFDSYTVPPITINSGDFVVGFWAQNPPNVFPMAEDTNSGSKLRSYISTDGVNFTLIDTLGIGGNYGIRCTVDVAVK